MKRAAVSLLALCALCVPTVLKAQEASLAAAASKALQGFGAGLRSSCFRDWSDDSRRIRIAIAQMDYRSTTNFTKRATEIITDTIEHTLGKDDRSFQVVPRRQGAPLDELMKQLAPGAPTMEPGFRPDVAISIEPGPQDRNGRPTVNVFAFTADRKCQHSADPITVGKIEDPPDVPDAFFKHAAGQLDDTRIERLLVMPADVGVGLGIDNSARIVVERLQNKLLSAIRETFTDRSHLRPYDRALPRVGLYGDGMEVSAAWQARLHLDRSARGIEVDVEFSDPGGHSSVFSVSGHFSPDPLLANARLPVLRLRAAKSPFHVGDQFGVRIEVLRPSRLFCFIWTEDGEATLLYPTYETLRFRESPFLPRNGEMKFPEEFNLPISLGALPQPAVEFFHCIATERPLPDKLNTLWLKNTAAQRILDKRNQTSVAPGTTRDILSGLRESEGYAEAWVKIEIVSE